MGSKRLNHVRKQTNENSSAGPIIERKYTLKPTASLTPHLKNPRRHPECPL